VLLFGIDLGEKKMRAKVGLPRIDLPNHACLFTESDLLQMTQDLFVLQKSYDTTSTYYFTSRIIHPLIAKVLGFDVKSDSRINLIASKLPSPEFLGLNKLYVFKKNG